MGGSEMKGLHAVIMAGGSGTRFWPMSREMWPKQMLRIVGDESMIVQTMRRVKGLVAGKNIHIVTTSAQAPDIKTHVGAHSGSHHFIITEPCGRNTAPAIGLAAIHLSRIDPEAVILVLPADHFIRDENSFRAAVRRGVRGASEGALVTIGIEPTRPDTGYGYIRRGSSVGKGLFSVEQFVEKPDRKRAERYLASGGYFWNSGIFIWRADAVLREIKAHMPALYRGLIKIGKALGTTGEERVVREVYDSFESVSIDYGVMERSKQVLMLPGDFDWSDVGSWSALDDLLKRDRHGVQDHAHLDQARWRA